jgi:DNA-binding NtrC family response regulator
MVKVLVVDDQQSVCTALEVLFDLHGMQTITAGSPEEAIDAIEREDIGVVIQDMNFRQGTTSGNEGVELMRSIRRIDPDVPIVLMTAFTSLEMAVQLIKEGANDYLAKPWDDSKLVATVKNLMRLRELSQENMRLVAQGRRARQELARRYDLRGLVYQSPQMQEVVSLAVRVAGANVPVLITGPNGSGKEKVAEIVQANSRRNDKPFVRVNSGGLPDTLLDAELFGAEAGAYTGATKTRMGRFEEAHGGTLFLDEIGNLSPNGQMKLLRVLQTGEFQRLGSNVTRKSDVRVISATNINLAAAIEAGSFREDLYFRLNVIEVQVPALRDRPDDIVPLAEFFVKEGIAGSEESVTLSEEARQALVAHEWPGNVRELQNKVQRSLLVRRSAVIQADDLGLAPGHVTAPGSSEPPLLGVDSERAEIEKALREARGVVARAAAQLGMSRQALYRRMERVGIALERTTRAK